MHLAGEVLVRTIDHCAAGHAIRAAVLENVDGQWLAGSLSPIPRCVTTGTGVEGGLLE